MYNKLKNVMLIMTLLLVASCQDMETDLNVPNLNDPDLDAISSDAASLEAVAKGIFQAWTRSTNEYDGPAMALQTMADAHTCSWGNAGMKDLSSEPRVAFDNSVAYGNDVTKTYFNALYKIVSDAHLLIYAIENETAELENPNQVLMSAKFAQAISIGYLALVFDRTWIPGPEGVSGDKIEATHAEAMTYALAALDEAIALADSGVSLPADALSSADVSGPAVSKLFNSFGARMLVGNVRNSTEKANIDWAKVQMYATNGITSDFKISMNGTPWSNATWQDERLVYLNYPNWGRTDLRIINMMAPTSIDYWTPTTVDPLPATTSPDARLASDFQYLSSNNYRPERGLYHFSNYRSTRADAYIASYFVDVVQFAKAENDMYLAEALVSQGNVAGAASIINAGTRVTRGNLSAVAANETDVRDAIFYEKMVEISFTAGMITFFEMRKENLLQEGTLLHFPVPGQPLETIPEDLYTYGGTAGVAGQDYSNGGWR